MCFIIPVVSTHHYDIYVSLQSKVNSYQRVTDTLCHCSSLIPMFKLLSSISNFTDVFIQSGMYSLNMSYTLRGLHNIQIRSNSSKPAVITCQNNSDVNTGVALLQVKNIIIDHLSIVGCGMKHISTNYHEKHNFISVYSAICIQNSTDIFLMDVNISNSTGIGLLKYHTNGLVDIKRCIFTNNTLSPLHSKASGYDNETSGGGIYIEFTNYPP